MRAERGFTLIELIITISVIGILAAFATPAFIESIRAYAGVSTNVKTVDTMRSASLRIARELREATPGTFTASANTVQFGRNDYYVTSGGTALTARTVTIAYDAVNKRVNLYYGTPATGAVPLVDNAAGLSFAYYDSTNTVTATASAIHFIEFTLTLTEPTSGQTVAQRTRVAVRNGI